jgi:biotin carboxyl carrier protein
MRARLLTAVTWLGTFTVLAGLLFGLHWLHERAREELEKEEKDEKAPAAKSPRNGIVQLKAEEVQRYGLRTEPARPVQWHEQTIVYGQVVPNPRATIEIRSPFAGTLRVAADSAWPLPGQRVRAGQKFGWVDVRVGPDVLLDLQNKLVDAQSKQRGIEKEIKIQEDRVKSLEAATSGQLLARTELDAALVQLTQAKTQLATTTATVELWTKAIEAAKHHKSEGNSIWNQPLTAPADGEVTQLAGRPGTAVEAGALVIQLVDFRQPLIRLDVPPELLAQGGTPARVRMEAATFGTALPTVEGQLVGPAPQVEAASQFVSYLYEVPRASTAAKENGISSGLWRPGRHVLARMRAEGTEAQPAVAVPEGAVLYHEGHPLVYVRVSEETFERRAVRLLGREDGRAILAARQGTLAVGVAPKEAVVTRQAQLLLSKEFLAVKPDTD